MLVVMIAHEYKRVSPKQNRREKEGSGEALIGSTYILYR
jgi:hypothetical protein